jgi:hypothetical protein
MVERHRLGKSLRGEPAPAAKQLRQLALVHAERAGKPRQIGFVGAVFAEVSDGGADGFVVGLGLERLMLCHDA